MATTKRYSFPGVGFPLVRVDRTGDDIRVAAIHYDKEDGYFFWLFSDVCTGKDPVSILSRLVADENECNGFSCGDYDTLAETRYVLKTEYDVEV